MSSIDDIIPFFLIMPVTPIGDNLSEIAKECVPSLMIKSLPSYLVEFSSEEVGLGASLS